MPALNDLLTTVLERGARLIDWRSSESPTPEALAGHCADLQESTGMHIIEVRADDPYRAQAVISAIPRIASVTQLGVRLRVLLPDTVDDPVAIVNGELRGAGLDATAILSTASLEDVFVAVTLKPARHAA